MKKLECSIPGCKRSPRQGSPTRRLPRCMVNAKQYKAQRDAAWEVMRKVRLSFYLMNQNLRLSGMVSPESPGGQLTAYLPDGTPVDRCVYQREAYEAIKHIELPPGPCTKCGVQTGESHLYHHHA